MSRNSKRKNFSKFSHTCCNILNIDYIDDDNVNTTQTYDSTQFNWDNFSLKAGDPVWVKVSISLDAFANGGGSYAEINYSDGTANYIEPLFLSAQAL